MIKIDENTLSNIVRESIYKLLKEESGVATVVTNESNRIIEQIGNLIPNSEKEKYDGFIIRHNEFQIVLFGDYEVNVSFYFYNFRDEHYYEEFISDNTNIFFGRSSFSRTFIQLVFFAIHGEIDEKAFNDQCQHEVSHIYRAYMKKGELITNKRRSLYDKSLQLMRSNENGGFDNLIGTILYASFEEEQNAFINGMYNLLMSTCETSIDADTVWKQSDAYILFSKLKYFEQVLNSAELDDEDLNNLDNSLKKLGNSNNIPWIKNKLSNVIQSYGNKLIRGYNKSVNDLKKLESKRGYLN